MSRILQLRRGTKAQLDAITLSTGEIGWTTDGNEVYVGDGSGHHLIGSVKVGAIAARPSAGVAGRICK